MSANSKLRVLFALPGLHRVNRGAEVVLEEVGRRAARDHGLDVTLIGSGQDRSGEPYEYRQVSSIRRESFEHFPKIPYARDLYAWEELFYAPRLLRAYSPREFDVTLTCGYPYTNWVLRSRRRGGRPRHIFVTQNGDWMVQARNSEFKHFGCDGLICTNPEYFERHREKYRCALIPNGVDLKSFGPAADRAVARREFDLPIDATVILIVSALIPSKRVMEAIRLAHAAMPDGYVVVAGDGEQRGEVDSLGRELLGPRFRRLTLPRTRMPDLYRCGDVLLHLSRDEAFGNVFVEALASGLPIVAHDTPATRWIVEDQARLVDTSDAAAVSEALRRAVKDRSPEKSREIAERRFGWEIVAKQYCEFFEDVHRHAS
jgi:glycosyltransferase involved in cell wall biosynthesis